MNWQLLVQSKVKYHYDPICTHLGKPSVFPLIKYTIYINRFKDYICLPTVALRCKATQVYDYEDQKISHHMFHRSFRTTYDGGPQVVYETMVISIFRTSLGICLHLLLYHPVRCRYTVHNPVYPA